MHDETPAIICLNQAGLGAAQRLVEALDGELHGLAGRVNEGVQFDGFIDHIQGLFIAGRPIIGVCAAGTLIRAVAPLLRDKWREPPVIAVSSNGQRIAPLLGGHKGGNQLARQAAAALYCSAAITTAGDDFFSIAMDDPPSGWCLEHPKAAKPVMAAALSTEDVTVRGDAAWVRPMLRHSGVEHLSGPEGRVEITAGGETLVYAEQRLALGLGAARGVDLASMRRQVDRILNLASASRAAIAAVFSIDLKADEAAINAIARELDVPFRTFTAAELEEETPRVAHRSEVVFQEVGTHSVAEAAALRGAGPQSRLLHSKIKGENCTAALAIAPGPITDFPGRPRGRLSLIGTGPGRPDQRTPEATRLAAEAEELVGYGLYLDLLGPLAPKSKRRTEFGLGEEEARCRYALERAGEGVNVALVCSGDPSIYAMGALVMELLDRSEKDGGVSAQARRAELIISPGVSALQSASARAGALLGHDFCAISLSDLLTPWEAIEKRIKGAAAGDFVVAFYNPVSERRRWQLEAARDILLTARPNDTPVLLARDVGRPEEQLRHTTLKWLQADDVDMLTVVLVGSSQSRLVESDDYAAGAGKWRLYTPRGYAKKIDASGD